MRKRTLIIVSCLIVVVAAIVLVRPDPPLAVTASFRGYTNGPTGGRLAMFAVTNGSSVTIRRWGIYCPESQQQPGLRQTLHLGPNVFLTPGQSEVISAAVPTPAEVWRVTFHCSRDGWRRRFSDWMGQRSGGLINAVVPGSWRGVPIQSVESGWIEP